MPKDKGKKRNVELTYIYPLITFLIVFVVYSFSLFRGWQSFDERLFHQETLFPIPTKFGEIFEVINAFVLNYHTESMNVFFSNHMTVRANPIASMLIVFTSFFFKKSALMYHLLQVSIHLANTVLVWFIFYNVSKIFFNKDKYTNLSLYVTLFTCIWALHSANTEAVLLVTNWTTILTYTFSFGFLVYEVSQTKNYKPSKIKSFFITILFCLTMLFTEYAYTLPLIMSFVLFGITYKQLNKLKDSASISLSRSSPYFFGLILFILLSSLKAESPLNNLITELFSSNETTLNIKHISPLYIFFERNTWLVPQIFLHSLKLLFFPKTLSTYQSSHIHLANTLIEPYSLFCIFIYISFLLIPLLLLLCFKNPIVKSTCLFIYAFYFALMPVLHILIPTYCLSADRYCYFPLFFLLLGVLSLTTDFLKPANLKPIVIVLSCIALLLTARTLIRIREWNNPYLLYKSAIKVDKNLLYKAQKLIVYGDFVGAQGKQKEMEKSLQESLKYSNIALNQLEAKRKKYTNQPITLKQYGLDYDSLVLKAAYLIATVKNDNYVEPPENTLAFYEPYIKDRLNIAGISQIALFADILLKSNEIEKLKNTLEYAIKRFPCSSSILYSLADYYTLIEKDLDKAHEVLQKAYKYFPNNAITLRKLQQYYETLGNKDKNAEFSYLLGLRLHSEEDYQRTALIYLNSNQITQAHKTLIKLAGLNSNNPFTLLLTSIYLDKIGNKNKSLEILNAAYSLSKVQGEHQNIHVTKNILTNLAKVYATKGDLVTARKYLNEFASIKGLNSEDIRQLSLIKAQFKL